MEGKSKTEEDVFKLMWPRACYFPRPQFFTNTVDTNSCPHMRCHEVNEGGRRGEYFGGPRT